MPYYNRREHLARSMRAYESLYDDIKLSICDDRSRPPLMLPATNLNIKLTRIEGSPEPKNPCVPMNMAVNASKDDIIVLTNPEVEHVEPIFAKMLAALRFPNDYVIAACRCAHTGRWEARSGLRTKNRQRVPQFSGFHFCTMLHRGLWNAAGGFDEEYREHRGCEDNDWLWRLQDVGANFIPLDDCIVYHHPTPEHSAMPGGKQNQALLQRRWGHKWNR
jgi:GT2 family glycosyltransferase